MTIKRECLTCAATGSAPSPDHARAVDLLLRAAAKAKAARRATGEESEEEAPVPQLPKPRTEACGS